MVKVREEAQELGIKTTKIIKNQRNIVDKSRWRVEKTNNALPPWLQTGHNYGDGKAIIEGNTPPTGEST